MFEQNEQIMGNHVDTKKAGFASLSFHTKASFQIFNLRFPVVLPWGRLLPFSETSPRFRYQTRAVLADSARFACDNVILVLVIEQFGLALCVSAK
jgi:hypothetical protein